MKCFLNTPPWKEGKRSQSKKNHFRSLWLSIGMEMLKKAGATDCNHRLLIKLYSKALCKAEASSRSECFGKLVYLRDTW